jgi:hypothetical protein
MIFHGAAKDRGLQAETPNMVPITVTGEKLWQRMGASVENVQRRLRRAVGVLKSAGLPYAVVGGNAVQGG